ncbi:unnamed protein product [Lactuca saligna]|uniref:Uncharacterized protein n=1 Tax=Lactuca saligna TaxID=75948 RepID=A0AA35ZCU1_LACSI|nr:unnamed protein product [Lactuca saligna]
MRFKKGSKVEVMNNVSYYDYEGVEKVSRRFIKPCVRKKIGSKICEEEDDASRKQKRASPFCSSVHESSQKVKPGSQRRYVSCDSYKKSYKIGGMHLLLPKIQNKILILLPFCWKKSSKCDMISNSLNLIFTRLGKRNRNTTNTLFGHLWAMNHQIVGGDRLLLMVTLDYQMLMMNRDVVCFEMMMME